MVDWKLMDQFRALINKEKQNSQAPIFIVEGKRVFNSSINKILEKHCIDCNIPIISIHSLRHTHASLLLYEGVSKELENKDNDKVLHTLSQLS